jgi:hypothetical protein
MKPSHYSVIVSLVLLLACTDSDNPNTDRKPVQLGSTARAVQGEIVLFGDTATSLAVEITKISDSRCPIGAVCVWAGYVHVDFLIGPQKEAVRLCIHQELPDCKKEANVTIADKVYTLTLLDVSPETNPPEKQLVEFSLK